MSLDGRAADLAVVEHAIQKADGWMSWAMPAHRASLACLFAQVPVWFIALVNDDQQLRVAWYALFTMGWTAFFLAMLCKRRVSAWNERARDGLLRYRERWAEFSD